MQDKGANRLLHPDFRHYHPQVSRSLMYGTLVYTAYLGAQYLMPLLLGASLVRGQEIAYHADSVNIGELALSWLGGFHTITNTPSQQYSIETLICSWDSTNISFRGLMLLAVTSFAASR